MNRDEKIIYMRDYRATKSRGTGGISKTRVTLRALVEWQSEIIEQKDQQIATLNQKVAGLEDKLDQLVALNQQLLMAIQNGISVVKSQETQPRPSTLPEFDITESATAAEDTTAAMLAALDGF